MSWKSSTGQFTPTQMRQLERWSVSRIARVIVQAKPLTTFHAVVEVMLNGDDDKLAALMANPAVAARLVGYDDDRTADLVDDDYAKQLRARFPQ